ncbi:MAG: AMP-binding protein [Candidatus Latescibacterota bacterium]|nr:MAG: AMP-binding protein [Candidatus Latescibacterota bacterium]
MRLKIASHTLVELGLDPAAAEELCARLEAIPADTPPAGAWLEVSRTLLGPDIPFPVHAHLYQSIFAEWDHKTGPPPAWIPSVADIVGSNIAALCKRAGVPEIRALHQWSAQNREEFWSQIIDTLTIRFKKHPQSIVDVSDGVTNPSWLPGARLNIAESCFQTKRDRPSIVYQDETANQPETISYDQLDRLSNRVANGLVGAGFEPGDAIAIAMPMTVESVAAYLGVVKAGCVVVSVADSFAPKEIGTRLRIAAAKAVVTQDVVRRAHKLLPMYEKVVAAIDSPARVIVAPTAEALTLPLRNTDVEWAQFVDTSDRFDPVSCQPDDPSNILFSSGTTAEPKAIPWTHATPIKCAMDGHLHHDIKPGEVVAWPTNIGWMMGPWLIYATLINGGTMALYYGSPVTSEFCRFVQTAQVNLLGVVPSLVKAWQNTGAADGLDWSSIRAFTSTGESSNPGDYLYLMSLAGYRPVIEYCGGTEIGGGYISGTVVQPASPSTFSTPAFGLDFCILGDDGTPAPSGELFIIPPSIGLSNQLLNRDHHAIYYRGTPTGPNGEVLRRHGDEFEALPGGYYRGQGRADDTMNLGGIKTSSKEIERVIDTVPGVVESAAIAHDPPDGGPSRLVIFAVTALDPSGKPQRPRRLKVSMQRAIADRLNPLFKIHDVVTVESLPRTASNKVMRRLLRDQYGSRHA